MSKKICGFVAFVALCGLSMFLLNCGSSSYRPAGTLYVLTEGSNDNGLVLGTNISSLAVDLNTGNLSLVNSNASTCPTAASAANPEPCGLPLDILLDPAGAHAYVLNQGTPCELQNNVCVTGSETVVPNIYPYTVNSDGSLSNPGTAVTWTANGYPDTAIAMERDPAGQFLFVIDEGSYPSPGYPALSSPYPSCPHAPTGPSDVCPSISVFAMSSSGLTLEAGSPFYLSRIPTSVSALSFTPPGSSTAEELLFMSSNFDICTTASCYIPCTSTTVSCTPGPQDNTVSVYSVSSSGALTEQPNSPYVVAAVDPVSVFAVNTNPTGGTTSGVFVYVGQGGSPGAVYPFQLCTIQNAVCDPQQVSENLLIPITSCATSCIVSAGLNPVQMITDPTNNFLYVLSQGSSQVFGFRISTTTGTLSTLSPASEPTGSGPVAMALHPSVLDTGQYLYTSNSGASNISGFTLGTTSGTMSGNITVVAPAAPSGIAVH
jgi:Lactonase, 7-bladed beta-propeller